jgi:hypothetical protein
MIQIVLDSLFPPLFLLEITTILAVERKYRVKTVQMTSSLGSCRLEGFDFHILVAQ